MHNYGIAVDVTIVDENDKEIDMGFTPFYKSNLSIYRGYAKLKMFDLSEPQKKPQTAIEYNEKGRIYPIKLRVVAFQWNAEG